MFDFFKRNNGKPNGLPSGLPNRLPNDFQKGVQIEIDANNPKIKQLLDELMDNVVPESTMGLLKLNMEKSFRNQNIPNTFASCKAYYEGAKTIIMAAQKDMDMATMCMLGLEKILRDEKKKTEQKVAEAVDKNLNVENTSKNNVAGESRS